jgi:hypothetical protein
MTVNDSQRSCRMTVSPGARLSLMVAMSDPPSSAGAAQTRAIHTHSALPLMALLMRAAETSYASLVLEQGGGP